MFVNPSAIPSCVDRLRCVTRESCATASSSLRSRWASMSKGCLLTRPRSLIEGSLGVVPVVEVVKADAVERRHYVCGRGCPVEAWFRLEEQRCAKEVDRTVHHPHRRKILAPVDPASD